ncbi:MAG TPA: glycosyltransferase family 39 protein [Candidatus Nitrosocosmicus sp.]|nr:glycosyltransferase family 39 protein [Candidatus Nitrosocosmicus sp.]
MFRSLHFLTIGNTDWNPSFYDHPYFGPILLASVLYVINYPSNIAPDIQDQSSVYSSYSVPRIIMGIFAVVDTLLIYTITKIRYGRNVAIISALLFSVMPFTWVLRRIYLESLLYPLLLSSVLIVVYLNSLNYLKPKASQVLIFMSGILLGLAIFTKAPLIAMIPLLTFYTYKYNRKISQVVLFLLPVIIISLVWPLDAIVKGEYQQWILGLSSQIERQYGSIFDAMYDIFLIDPVILTLGLFGTALAIVKRDSFLLLGIIPFIVFFTIFISYVNWFYFIPIFGFLCIASGVLLERINRHINRYKATTIVIPSIVIVFGFFSTFALISTNISSFQYEAMSYINTILIKYNTTFENKSSSDSSQSNNSLEDSGSQKKANYDKGLEANKSTVIIASPIYSWIYKFIYHYDNTFYSYSENNDIKNGSKLVLVLDRYFREYLTNNLESRNNSWNQNLSTLGQLYEAFDGLDTSRYFSGTSKNYDMFQYPYTSMRFNLGGSPIEIRSN